MLAVLIALAANYVYGIAGSVSKDNDFKYIAENCSRITPEQAENIAAHITYDRSFFGNIYIFDQVAGEFSKGDFEAAFRGPSSEFFCLPVAGCLFPPILRKACDRQKG